MRYKPLQPFHQFVRRRLLWNAAASAGVVLFSLVLGAVGYHGLENLGWVDAFLNASMILTGMGPVAELRTTAGKVFATCYAIFSGVVFLTAVAVLFALLFHRALHRFHLEFEESQSA